MHAPKALSPSDFVTLVRETDPNIARVLDEHFKDNDELLIHLLMADLLRFAVERFGEGDLDASGRVVEIVDRALVEGDAALVNAVAVSFVEHSGSGPGESPSFIASWSAALLNERRRQHYSGRP